MNNGCNSVVRNMQERVSSGERESKPREEDREEQFVVVRCCTFATALI